MMTGAEFLTDHEDASPVQTIAEPESRSDKLSEMPLPSDPQTVFLGGLFFLATLAALNVAHEIALPVALAIVLKLLLQPAVRVLGRLWVPRPIGALLAIGLVFGIVFGLGAALSGPAASWATKLPAGVSKLEERLSFLKRPIDAVQRVLQQAERVVKVESPGIPTAAAPVAVTVQQPRLVDGVFAGARAIVDGLFTTVLVLFFLLMSGDMFLRRLVEILPRFKDKRQAVEISHQIESDISAYLVTITLVNAAVGVATAAIMWSCGLGDPLLWGALAFALNYVPILGPLVGMGVFLLAGLISFETLWLGFLPAILYLIVHLIEGETVTPMLLAKRFTLNPVLVILAFVFWYWMWGVPGAILAVPMLAIVKIICDRVESLSAVGHFLEG